MASNLIDLEPTSDGLQPGSDERHPAKPEWHHEVQNGESAWEQPNHAKQIAVFTSPYFTLLHPFNPTSTCLLLEASASPD